MSAFDPISELAPLGLVGARPAVQGSRKFIGTLPRMILACSDVRFFVNPVHAASRLPKIEGLGARMLLIGVNRSPFTRRVAITLHIYGLPFEQRALSGFADRVTVRTSNPLGRIPALVLDDGETLVDSGAIIDHLDEAYSRDRALAPP